MSEVPLREYVDRRIDTLEAEIRKAEESLEKRLHGMNEIRETLRDAQTQMASREYVEGLTRQLQKDIELLRVADQRIVASIAKMGGAAAAIAFLVGLAVAVGGLVVGG